MGSIHNYIGAVQVPMIYNALMRSEDTWSRIEIYSETAAPLGSSVTADPLLRYFHRKADVTLNGSVVELRLEPAG
jgi:hypothetical protein